MSPSEHPPSDRGAHVCWGFTNRADFRAGAVEFLRAGIARNERLMFAADAPAEQLIADVAELGDVGELVSTGSLQLVSLGDAYDITAPLDWRDQAATFERLAIEARAAGFTGLRVAADATPLVLREETRAAFLDWELAADALMVRKPISGFCAFDVRMVGDAMPQLGAVHAWRRIPAVDPAFSLFFETETTLRLVGEIDVSNRELFDEAMRSALVVHPAQRVEVDLSDLTFIDIGGLRQFDQLCRELRTEERSMSLVGWRPLFRECAARLDFSGLAGAIDGGAS